MGGDCFSLAPPGSSGPLHQGVCLTGGDCHSLAPPGSSDPPRQGVSLMLSGSLTLFPFLFGLRAIVMLPHTFVPCDTLHHYVCFHVILLKYSNWVNVPCGSRDALLNMIIFI